MLNLLSGLGVAILLALMLTLLRISVWITFPLGLIGGLALFIYLGRKVQGRLEQIFNRASELMKKQQFDPAIEVMKEGYKLNRWQFLVKGSIDGQIGEPLEKEDSVICRSSQYALHLIRPPRMMFFDVLRQKKIVNAKEVIRYDIEGLSQTIASTKRIGSYEIWQEDLPRSTTRKIKRFEVEKRGRENQARKLDDDAELPAAPPLTEEDAAWLDQPDVRRALKIVREAAPAAPPALRPTHNLDLDLGLDSMQRVELLSQIEEQIGGNVEESQLA